MKHIALIIVATLATSAAMAETKQAKPVACQSFTEARTDTGAIGVCRPLKEGGKPTYLTSYKVVEVVDPATGKPVRVLVGFR